MPVRRDASQEGWVQWPWLGAAEIQPTRSENDCLLCGVKHLYAALPLLYRYGGHLQAALVLGGVDIQGASLYSIYPHGSCDSLPFASMGSGR